uniref:Sema domain-containing protein n=1 Tax=Zonotrichia albicollis TaxID=44394 RepID=A0A8D2NGR7_ZONAL
VMASGSSILIPGIRAGAAAAALGGARPTDPSQTWHCTSWTNTRDGMDFQALLVDEDRAWLMVGAKNHIFLLHLDHPSREPEKIFWPAPREQVEHCQLAGKNVETECANFVRLLQPYNQSHVFACGTGSYQPVCAFIQLGARAEGRLGGHCWEQSVLDGDASHPHPHPAGGELYSGTSSDFMGSSAAFFRTWGHIVLLLSPSEPVFVGAYTIPDTYNPHDDKVYIFFRETAMDAGQWEQRHIHARVARVCKNDVGGKRGLINRWSTFLKARLVCSIPGPQGTETHFDQLEDVFLLRTRDPQNPLVFGLFTVSSGVFSGSAVCIYSMAAVRAAFSGPFAHKEGFDYRWVEYKGRVPYPQHLLSPSSCTQPPHPPRHSRTMCSRSCPTRARLGCIVPTLQPPRKPQEPQQQWGQQAHQAQGTEQHQPPRAHGTVPQRYPAFTQLSPGEQTSHQRQGPRAGCQRRGQLAIAKDPTDLPWPWAVLRNLLYCPNPLQSPELLSSVLPTAPLRTSSCFPSGSFGDRNSAAKEEFNPCR